MEANVRHDRPVRGGRQDTGCAASPLRATRDKTLSRAYSRLTALRT